MVRTPDPRPPGSATNVAHLTLCIILVMYIIITVTSDAVVVTKHMVH